jgi:hypothetical protein
MDTNPLGRRGLRHGLIMGVLGARRHPDAATDRIDVRRGDQPYERVVGESPADPATRSAARDRPPGEPEDEST